MYTFAADNSIVRIQILGIGWRPNCVKVHTIFILSSKDMVMSLCGQITYDIHKSFIFKTKEKAKKALFIKKLKGKRKANG